MKTTAPFSSAKQRLLGQYLKGAVSSSVDAIRPRKTGATAPLSFSQEEVYWRELRLGGVPALYNECITIRMLGALNTEALQRAFNEIVRRHEAWRTTFETLAGAARQLVQSAESIDFDFHDLRAIPQQEREAEIIRIVGEKSKQQFHLNRGPLLRPTLFRVADSEYRLYLVAHQIILDGMSAYQIFPSELASLYLAFSKDEPSPLPELPIQYGDFACWQREYLQKELPKQTAYWRKVLGRSRVPTHLLAAQRTFRGRIEPFSLPESLGHQVRELARSLNTTTFLVLLTALATVISRRDQQEIVTIGTPSPSGRKRSEVLGLLGYFLNPVALTLTFGKNPSFRDSLLQARGVIAEAISNDDVPIESLARALKCEDIETPNPLFTVSASMQPPQPSLGLPWTVTSMDVESGGSPWRLYFAFIETPQAIFGRAQFNPDLFDTETVREILQGCQTVLRDACSQSLAVSR